MSNQWPLMLLYLSYFYLWLPLSAWMAFKSRTHRFFWSTVAVLLWGGLVLALAGRYGGVSLVREVGASMVWFGLLGLFLWIAATALRRLGSIKLRR